MSKKLALYVFFLFLSTISCENATTRRYDDYQVYRITPHTLEQLVTLQQIELYGDGFDFWTSAVAEDQPVDIMVPPHLIAVFQNYVELHNLDAKLWIENVQQRIENENPQIDAKSQTFNWKNYHTLEKLNGWLKSLAQKYPKTVTTVVGGKSYEGRQILGVKVSFGPGKKGVFLEGGIHAREWISPATVTYILNALLSSSDPAVLAVAKSYDWYVFPVINPDGYAYTHARDRMWRKTRKPYGKCYGADPNRNWNYHWFQGGASNAPCSEAFAGSAAFSEIETKSLSEYISTIANKLEAYIAFHSYSQLLLLPFGHQGHEKPENNNELFAVGRVALKKLTARYGTQYKIGNIPEAIYVASGGSMDWARGTYRHIRLAYTFELRDKGRYGFILPKEQIIPSGEETLDAVVEMFRQTAAKED